MGQWLLPAQSVAQVDDLPLPRGEILCDEGVQLLGFNPQVDLVVDVAVVGHDVLEGQRIAVLVGIDRVVDEDVLRKLAPPAEVHQNLIFDTPARVSREFRSLLAIEGGDRLDQPDRADRNQVVLVLEVGVVLFDDVRHQAQVVLDELVFRLGVPLPRAQQVFPLLLGAEGAGEGAAAGDVQGKI